jgi:hypothetical protein
VPQALTWRATTNKVFSTATNWTPNGVPASGDTLTYDATSFSVGLPMSAFPTTGTFHVVISGMDGNYSMLDFMGFSDGYVLGNLTVSATQDDHILDLDAGGGQSVTGNLSVTHAQFLIYVGHHVTGTTTIGAGGALQMESPGIVTLTGAVTVAATGTIIFGYSGQTLAVPGGITVNGTLTVPVDGILTLSAGVLAGTGTVTLNGRLNTSIDVAFSGLTMNLAAGTIYCTGAVTIDGASATSITNTSAVIAGATVQNMNTPWHAGDYPLRLIGGTLGDGNGTSVRQVRTRKDQRRARY